LSEGFATYFAGLFLQRFEGEDAFQVYMRDAATTVFAYEKKRRASIFDPDTEDLMELLNANSYQKGAWVLHMLRSDLGDEAFFRGLRNYYKAHKNSTATTEDLRAALEQASSKPLYNFFARWVYDSGHPQYELTWEWVRKKELRLTLTQVQPGNVFLDPLPLKISTASGAKDILLQPTSKLLIKAIRLTDQPTRIEIDPHNVLLDEATVKGS
jgi:aminopeptidase N